MTTDKKILNLSECSIKYSAKSIHEAVEVLLDLFFIDALKE
jgi:hypothetical protein